MTIVRKISAALVAIIILAGTIGLTVVQHDCAHCGTDYALAFQNSQQESCCSEPPASKCCEGEKDEPCSIDDQSCCTYAFDTRSISDPFEVNHNHFYGHIFIPERELVIAPDHSDFYSFILPLDNPEKPPGSLLRIMISSFLT